MWPSNEKTDSLISEIRHVSKILMNSFWRFNICQEEPLIFVRDKWFLIRMIMCMYAVHDSKGQFKEESDWLEFR